MLGARSIHVYVLWALVDGVSLKLQANFMRHPKSVMGAREGKALSCF